MTTAKDFSDAFKATLRFPLIFIEGAMQIPQNCAGNQPLPSRRIGQEVPKASPAVSAGSRPV